METTIKGICEVRGSRFNCDKTSHPFFGFMTISKVMAPGWNCTASSNALRGGAIVFNDQDARQADAYPGRRWRMGKRSLNRQSNRKREIETTSLAYFAVQSELTAVQFDQAMSDGKAKARALGFLAGFVKAIEGFEDALLFGGRDARPIVAHFDANASAGQVRSDFDVAAFWSELDSVAEQVHQHLLDPDGIGAHD